MVVNGLVDLFWHL